MLALIKNNISTIPAKLTTRTKVTEHDAQGRIVAFEKRDYLDVPDRYQVHLDALQDDGHRETMIALAWRLAAEAEQGGQVSVSFEGD